MKPDEDEDLRDPEVRANVKATIFFSYTSNMVSCGVRETIRFLAQHKMVDAIVTSAGGVGASRFKEVVPEGEPEVDWSSDLPHSGPLASIGFLV